jgi:endo-1,4-beta-xylanase
MMHSVLMGCLAASLTLPSLNPANSLSISSMINPETTLRSAAEPHNIKIGTAVATNLLSNETYAKILSTEFNLLEPENDLKFGPVHPEPDRYNFATVDKQVAFAKAHNMSVRGHTLVWHSQYAPWLTQNNYTPKQLNKILKDHIFTVMRRYRGTIRDWDVVNEAIADDAKMRKSIWYNDPGIGFVNEDYAYIAQAFRWAHEADPTARLFYNDYNTESLGPKSNQLYKMVKQLLSEGVPIHGIGFQCHFVLGQNNPEFFDSFNKNIARFKELGLDVQFTELDIRMHDPKPGDYEKQADFYNQVVQIALENEVSLIQIWGISDAHSWIPSTFKGEGWALPWDDKYQKKPAYSAILSALTGGQ